jgi:hypothetical protein
MGNCAREGRRDLINGLAAGPKPPAGERAVRPDLVKG